MRICRCNKLIFGVVVGLVLPILTSYLFYVFSYKGDKSIYCYFDFLMNMRDVGSVMSISLLGKLFSISVLPNLALFMMVITYEKLLIARGLVIATFCWLVFVLAVRFLL
ncbi:MAG: hypothetical protein JW717_06355 [Marinilabiliaceae bacterium]|nr:hypothetical protein [Marinilabiliaceae bacterium]